jgi:hypothetical protein
MVEQCRIGCPLASSRAGLSPDLERVSLHMAGGGQLRNRSEGAQAPKKIPIGISKRPEGALNAEH